MSGKKTRIENEVRLKSMCTAMFVYSEFGAVYLPWTEVNSRPVTS